MTTLCSHHEDITAYNDIIFKANSNLTERNHMTPDTNATEVYNVSTYLTETKFDQLHHVTTGALVMFTLLGSLK